MPLRTNINLRATAGDLGGQEQFYIGQDMQNNEEAATEGETAANAPTTITPAVQAALTPALNRRLFTGAGTRHRHKARRSELSWPHYVGR